ncbi:helix-turn-helix domain-containing protein [Bdellovibrionota bacterium FG-1]
MTHDEILTLPEVAELLRIAEKTVYSLAQKAELPAFKVGGQWRFSRAAIDSWIQGRTLPQTFVPRTTGKDVLAPERANAKPRSRQ